MRDLLGPASREQGDDRSLGVEAELAPEGEGIRGRVHQAHERMADERDRHAGVPVELFLEREDDEHPGHGVTDVVDPAAPPGPELRGDVIDDGDSAAMERPRQAEVEVRVVDQHRRVGRVPLGLLDHSPEDRAQVAEVGDDFEQPDDGEVADVREQGSALGLQPVAAQAEHIEAGHALAQMADELGAVEIARGFAARDEQAGHRKAEYIRVIRESQAEGGLSLRADIRRGSGRDEPLDPRWF